MRCGRTAPEVTEEEGSYASLFYPWFLESFKSCLLLLVALPGLIDTLAQLLARRFLLWLTMTWRQRFLTQSNFLSTTSLACVSGSTSIVLFSQVKLLPWTEINTYTHTPAVCTVEHSWVIKLVLNLIISTWIMYFIKSALKFPFIPLQRFSILRDLKAEDLMVFPDEVTKRRHFLPKYTR